MVRGQGALSQPLDVGALDQVDAGFEARLAVRGAAHVADLRGALEVHRIHADAGMPLSAVSHLALLLRCSEQRAVELLGDAQVLVALPGAFEAITGGVLLVEDCRAVCALLSPLSDEVRLSVWQRLLPVLTADAEQAVVRPRARLRSLVDRIAKQVDAAGAEQRRRDASDGRAVTYRRRDDGLVDLFALGLTGPNAQACLARIRDAAAPLGPDDERTADQRRLDALVSLLLGREHLPFDADGQRVTDGPTGRCGCGCSAVSPVPCGTGVTVLVPLGAALGTTDEVAELTGHGPLDPDLLEELLLAAPELQAVFIDEHGVPVVMGHTARVERGDAAGLREALLRFATAPPPDRLVPRHPDDHPSDRPPLDDRPPGHPPDDSSPGDPPPDDPPPDDRRNPLLPHVLLRPHPALEHGPYRPSASLVALLRVRAPRCEWPGCGARAACCDQDHDTAWPFGPTCGCNLGTLCRRHHRVKQEGWTKRRRPDGVFWTSPAGRTWHSPNQHPAPEKPTRPVPSVHAPHSEDRLSPLEREQLLWDLDPANPLLDGAFDDTAPVHDIEPDGLDSVQAAMLDDLTRWTLDLDDPYAWSGIAAPSGGG